MTHLLKPFEYHEPRTVEEAVGLLSSLPGKVSVLAGGTDLLVSMKRGHASPEHIVYIGGIGQLDYITEDADGTIRIGALTSHQSVARSPIVRERCGFLARACGKVGGFQIRHMGTIGGNVCQAGPSQDSLPSLLVLDARLRLVGPEGSRTLSLDEFLTGPFRTVIRNTEVLTEILIPKPPEGARGVYLWETKNTGADETLVGVALLLASGETGLVHDIRIGLGSVGPRAIRAKRAEGLLAGRQLNPELIDEAALAAAGEINPRSLADYRTTVTAVLVERALGQVCKEIEEMNGSQARPARG